MSIASILAILITVFILLEYSIQKVLDFLNNRHWSETLPEEAKEFYDPTKYKEAKKYHEANASLSLVSGLVTLLITLGMIYFNGFRWLDDIVRTQTVNPVLISLYYFGLLGLASTIVSIPFSWYQTFVIEEKFGFNKSTKKLFVIDLFKGLALGAIIGGVLLAAIQAIYMLIPGYFWWMAGLLVAGVTVFFAMFYTTWIVPLFNKLTPLEAGELKDRIDEYCKKVDFPLTEISVIDGSKRSNKSNAFFSGLGPKKSIVLYDTLIKEQTVDEIVAVLAHEVGHYKKKHIYKSLVLSLFQIFLLFALIGYFLENPYLCEALGVSIPSFHISLIGFSFLYSPFSIITGILMNAYSRKNEFEADDYAKQTYHKDFLISALKKLTVQNLSNLTPHPWHVFFHYSHPPVLERIKTMNS